MRRLEPCGDKHALQLQHATAAAVQHTLQLQHYPLDTLQLQRTWSDRLQMFLLVRACLHD